MKEKEFMRCMEYLGGLKKRALAAQRGAYQAEDAAQELKAVRECETIDLIIHTLADLPAEPEGRSSWWKAAGMTFVSFALGLGLGGLAFLGIRLLAGEWNIPVWGVLGMLAALALGVTGWERRKGSQYGDEWERQRPGGAGSGGRTVQAYPAKEPGRRAGEAAARPGNLQPACPAGAGDAQQDRPGEADSSGGRANCRKCLDGGVRDGGKPNRRTVL